MFIIVKTEVYNGEVKTSVEYKTGELGKAQKFLLDSVNNALTERDGLEFIDGEEISDEMDLSYLCNTQVGSGVSLLTFEPSLIDVYIREYLQIIEI